MHIYIHFCKNVLNRAVVKVKHILGIVKKEGKTTSFERVKRVGIKNLVCDGDLVDGESRAPEHWG